MGFLSFLWCASTNHVTEADEGVDKLRGLSCEQDTASATGFLPISSGYTRDPTAKQRKKAKPNGKPPKYNRHNLPSMIVEDPPPWVTNYRQFKRRSDGTLFVA